jgi:hypothetical protein
MYVEEVSLDGGLMRALRGGAEAMPADLERLRAYLTMTRDLLAEKASEIEPTWALACQAAAEVETLHRLERQVVEKTASVPATNLREVLIKLDVWAEQASTAEDDALPRDAIVRSVRRDLERLLAIGSAGRS